MSSLTHTWSDSEEQSVYATSMNAIFKISSINKSVTKNIPPYSIITEATIGYKARRGGLNISSSNTDAVIQWVNENLDCIKTIVDKPNVLTTEYQSFSGPALSSFYSNSQYSGQVNVNGATHLDFASHGATARYHYCKEKYITWKFTLPTYTIKASSKLGGTVSGDLGTYDVTMSNQTKTIKANPSAGYKFVGWKDDSSGNIVSTDASLSITISHNNISAHSTTVSYTAQFRPIYISYDSILSYYQWKNEGIIADDGVISNITDTGFTLKSNAGVGEATASSPYFPVEPGKSYKIDIDFSGTNWDVYIFFCAADGRWVDFVDGPTNRFSHDGSTGISKDNAIFTAPNKTEVVKACIRVDSNGANNTVSFNNFRIYPADYRYMSNTVSATERTDAISWSMPTPTREGYAFKGWNTKPDGSGITYTNTSAFPSVDTVLYSQWEIAKTNKIFIDNSSPKKIYIDNKPIKTIYIDQIKVYG